MSAELKLRVPRTRNAIAGSNTKSEILDAAEEVIAASGAQSLTLDAVYKQAGISKGGLLYHFRSKEALIDGMIERYAQRSFAHEEKIKRDLDGIEPGLDARAAIAQVAADEPGADRLGAALLAAVANDLERLAPIRGLLRQRFERMKQSALDFETAAVIELAVTGLSFLELLHLPPLAPEDRHRVLAALDRMAGGAGKLPEPGSNPVSSLNSKREGDLK